jgi:hypothetical protein
MVTAVSRNSHPCPTAAALVAPQAPELSRTVVALATGLGAPIVEDLEHITSANRSILAVYHEQGPAMYGQLPTLVGVAFVDVSGVPESALLEVSSSLVAPYQGGGLYGESCFGVGLVVSDPATRLAHYGERSEQEICLDERAWARREWDGIVSPDTFERLAGWIFSLGQPGLVWGVSSCNYHASIARRWIGGCKG